MLIAHKIRIFPNQEQLIGLKKACGCARKAWNYTLSRWEEIYQIGGKPSIYNLKKEFNSIKKEQFPWMYESTKSASEQAIMNVGKAYQNFFKGIQDKRKIGKPKFKSKKSTKDSFYLCNTRKRIKDQKFFIPKIPNGIKMSEKVRFKGKIMSYTISRDIDRWYVSILIDADIQKLLKTNKIIGIDLGIKNLATLSDGSTIKNPNILNKQLKKLAKKQRNLSHKQKGSSNYKKAAIKVAKLHRTIKLTRKSVLQQMTTKLVRSYDTIVIEDLNVKNMVKNHKFSRSIHDCGFGMFRTILENKCKMYDKTLIIADRFFPSSKQCSKCGNKKNELKISERIYHCDICNFEIDRDINAAINLEKWPTCCRHQPVDFT